MRRKEDGPTVADGSILGHEDVEVAALLNSRSSLSGPSLGCQPAKLLDHMQEALDNIIPRGSVPRRQRQQPASWQVPNPEPLHAGAPSPILEKAEPQAGRTRLIADGMWASTLLLPTTKSDPREWPRFHRLVSLSGLGWAFVITAVLWEIFALAFSQCAGWGWDRGAFFFAWGLGILAFGFYQRTSRKRPAVSRLFLGVNVLMLSVFSLVVATR